jgi:hypothetical protein
MAVRVVGKTPVCDEHFRQRMRQPGAQIQERRAARLAEKGKPPDGPMPSGGENYVERTRDKVK